MGRTCIAPELLKGLPQRIQSTMGQKIEVFAEEVIFRDYTFFSAQPAHNCTFPNVAEDKPSPYTIQYFRDVSGLNTQFLIGFLKFNNPNNPNVNVQVMSIISQMKGGGIKNPDWMIDRKKTNNFEYYEVKPGSNSGTTDGVKKLLFFDAFFGLNSLPYKPGTRYNPRDKEEDMWIEDRGLFESMITLSWSRTQPGLIQYLVCNETKLKRPRKMKVRNPIDAVTLALLLMIWLGLEAAPVILL